MDIEPVSRNTCRLPEHAKDAGFSSYRFDRLIRPDWSSLKPDLGTLNKKALAYDFCEVHFSPGYGVPAMPPGTGTVTLVVDCGVGVTVQDSYAPTEVRRGDISLSIGSQLLPLRFSGRVQLYVLAIERSCMLHLANGHVGALPPALISPVRVRDLEITQSMCSLRECLASRHRTGWIYSEAYVNLIVSRALKRAGCVPLHAPDYKDPLTSATLTAVLDHMYEHVSDTALRSTTLAHIAGLPVDVFRHRFRKTLQQSVHQCLMEMRLEIALDRLAHTSCSVSQIAMDTGFADHSHFSRVFRERIGGTPSGYREFARSQMDSLRKRVDNAQPKVEAVGRDATRPR